MRKAEKILRRKNWTTTRMWEGQTCAVLASGPSMSSAVVEAIRVCPEIRVIVVNRTWELARWADLLYASDANWWTEKLSHLGGKSNYDMLAGFVGMKVCVEDTPFSDVMKLKDSGDEGFDDDHGAIRTGGNSGYGAVHIAAHLGCSRILLCGFDMRGGHWHERHAWPLRDAGEGTYERWIQRFATLAPELAKRGIETINCTPGSALTCFPMADLRGVLETRIAAAA